MEGKRKRSAEGAGIEALNEGSKTKALKRFKVSETVVEEEKSKKETTASKPVTKAEPAHLPKVNMSKRWNINPENDEGDKVLKPKVVRKANGLSYIDYVVGHGAIPKPGATVSIVYTGLLSDGTIFDNKLKRSKPLVFRKGVNQVIKGLDIGIEGMRIGGSREIQIPSSLGYGSAGMGGVPGDAAITFRLTLIS